MSKKILASILGIVIVIVIGIIFLISNFSKTSKQEDEEYIVSSLAELFPAENITQKFTDGSVEYEVSVTKKISEDDEITIVTEYSKEENDTLTTAQMTYEITSEKVTESGKYTSNTDLVSIIYPTELITGIPYLNMTWKSIDGLITNTVVSMVNNRVTIESIGSIDVYKDDSTKPIKKDYKETRVYEKGKGLVLYRTEVIGDKESIYENKIVD